MNKRLFVIVFCFVVITSIMFRENKNTSLVKYNGDNLRISVNGKSSKKLPTEGDYYLASYTCKSKSTKVSWDMKRHELIVSNGNRKGSVSCYLEFETHPKLAVMPVGSYVKYTGNNGCDGDSCLGKTKGGYCGSDSDKYLNDGYRIAYTGDNTAYLISAGAVECAAGIDDISNLALKYCNKNYIFGGICNNSVIWNMNSMDFRMITKSSITDVLCINKPGDRSCGYNNDLIDIGGNYFILVNNLGYGWNASKKVIESKVDNSYGVRPVIRLDSNVIVVGGDGSLDNPYELANNTFWVNNGNSIIGKNKEHVMLSLMSKDAKKMCISIDTSVCDEYIDYSDKYELDLSKETKGEKLIYVYYKNDSDRVIASINRSITIE